MFSPLIITPIRYVFYKEPLRNTSCNLNPLIPTLSLSIGNQRVSLFEIYLGLTVGHRLSHTYSVLFHWDKCKNCPKTQVLKSLCKCFENPIGTLGTYSFLHLPYQNTDVLIHLPISNDVFLGTNYPDYLKNIFPGPSFIKSETPILMSSDGNIGFSSVSVIYILT